MKGNCLRGRIMCIMLTTVLGMVASLCQAQVIELAVGEGITLYTPDPEYPYLDWANALWDSSEAPDMGFSQIPDKYEAHVGINRYFTGTQKITCTFWWTKVSSHGGSVMSPMMTKTWYFKCKGGGNGGSGGGTVTTGELHIMPETLVLEEGEEQRITCWAMDLSGSITDTWSSSNSSVATVERTDFYTAKVKAKSAGQCNISVTSGGLTATCRLTVNKKIIQNVAIDATNFPDANFRNYLLAQDYGADAILTGDEISKITLISVPNKNISSLKGIEYFTLITDLICDRNQLTSLDVSKNIALESLHCDENYLTALDVSKNTELKYLICDDNQLTALDVSKNKALEDLWCNDNQLTALDVSKNTELWSLHCYNNNIKGTAMDALINSLPQKTTDYKYEFNVIDPTSVKEGNVCTKAQVAAIKAKGWFPCFWGGYDYQYQYVEFEGSEEGLMIDATSFPDANFRSYLLAQDYGKDRVLTEDEIKSIKEIDVHIKNISSLRGIEIFTALTELECYGNQLTALDVSKNTALKYLWCYNNQLTALDVSKNTALAILYCDNNQLTALDVSKNTDLTYFRCYENNIKGAAMDALISSLPENIDYYGDKEITVIKNPSDKEGNVFTKLQIATVMAKGWIPQYHNGSEYVEYEYEDDTMTPVIINATNFPDENFRNYLLNHKYGKDGEFTGSEIKKTTHFTLSSKKIASLKGIEFFTALMGLKCDGNQLTTLDVSKNTALTDLSCGVNQLTALDVSKNTALEDLSCGGNQLTTLDVSKNTALTGLWCNSNQLTALDVSKNTALTRLYCGYNQLTALDVSKNTALTRLSCNNNQLTALDVSKNTALVWINCSGNNIKGKSMNGLINSLPKSTSSEDYRSIIVFTDEENDGNVCTKSQVAAIKAKGWIPNYYHQVYDWWIDLLEYEGSDDVQPQSITLPSSETVMVGKTVTLTATLTPDEAVTTLTWSSDDETIATVSSEGVVTGVKKGQTFINVKTDNGKTAVCKLTVTEPEKKVTSITLPSSSTVKIGQTVTLTPTLTPTDATTTLTWTSDDETIATVNSEGVVTGVKKGQTFINVETDNGKTAYCKLTVTVEEPTAISLPKNVTLMVDQNFTLTPTLTPADAETVLTWNSDDESVVRVSADGVLTGVAEGLAIVTVSTANGLTSGACKVKVVPDTTGICDVEADGHSTTPVYTLSGQRLAKPRKGLNIRGGKKIVVK